MSDRAVVEFEGLTFCYGGDPALEDVSLVMGDRELVSVVGPNGGGKTTLLRLILGLVPPTRGAVRVFGKAPREVRHRVGYVPQSFRFDPEFPVTVLDVVLMGRLRGGFSWGPYRRPDRTAAESALRRVDLHRYRNRAFAALSGGERQRVLIARALASDPELLLLDEPLAHIDALLVDDLYRLFKELSSRLTVVLVSHDVGFVSRLVQVVVCVNRQVTTHPTSEISAEVISRLYGTDVSVVRHDVRGGRGGEPCRSS